MWKNIAQYQQQMDLILMKLGMDSKTLPHPIQVERKK
jgi:hypothetical protein